MREQRATKAPSPGQLTQTHIHKLDRPALCARVEQQTPSGSVTDAHNPPKIGVKLSGGPMRLKHIRRRPKATQLRTVERFNIRSIERGTEQRIDPVGAHPIPSLVERLNPHTLGKTRKHHLGRQLPRRPAEIGQSSHALKARQDVRPLRPPMFRLGERLGDTNGLGPLRGQIDARGINARRSLCKGLGFTAWVTLRGRLTDEHHRRTPRTKHRQTGLAHFAPERADASGLDRGPGQRKIDPMLARCGHEPAGGVLDVRVGL